MEIRKYLLEIVTKIETVPWDESRDIHEPRVTP